MIGLIFVKITDISVQARNPDRVNISIDGSYRFSLDIHQVTELGIKKGADYSDEEIALFEQESIFGKLYARALEYSLSRPHSEKELRDYLWRKTRETKYKDRRSGEIKTKQGISQSVTEKVYQRLMEKGYVNDNSFARYWVENRSLRKGASARKLTAELRAKGVEQSIIDTHLAESGRNDVSELEKMILKKASRYDEVKLKQYLLRQGFRYDDINDALTDLAQRDQENETGSQNQ